MRLALALLLGRAARWVTRLRGGGSALPGLIARTLAPNILARTIGAIPGGIIFVTGSNGKSTTTAMLVSILRRHGLKVFSNPAGSNLPQGLASAVVAEATLTGALDCDIAVLEVDEAYGPIISAELAPDHLLVTNLQVDQLNRFGEPERVWEMMRRVCEVTRATLLVNARERPLVALAGALPASATLAVIDVSDAALRDHPIGLVAAQLDIPGAHEWVSPPATAVLESTSGEDVSVTLADGNQVVSRLPGPGLHYGIDATLALAMARIVCEEFDPTIAGEALGQLPPVYGRGESVDYKGASFHIVMQKNLPSMQVNLTALVGTQDLVWVAVDEGTPDPSWIFDLDLGVIDHVDVLSGSKAWHWATFLAYRGVSLGEVIEDTREAMDALAERCTSGRFVTAIVNYEQMMKLRRIAGYLELEGSG